MIRPCQAEDFEMIWKIINEAVRDYKGIIPEYCWKEPYMAKEELWHEIGAGDKFWGYYEKAAELVGVRGR